MFLMHKSSMNTTAWFFAQVVRRLVYEILSDVGNSVVQLRDFKLGLLPVLRELLLAAENTLQPRQFLGELLER
jgi:hypothetical protein